MAENAKETWGGGAGYEQYVGRWSRLLAKPFLAWLGTASGQVWGDVGCGTGALVERVLQDRSPALIHAADRAAGFLRAAREMLGDARVRWVQSDAQALAWATGSLDATISGLVLNFVPEPRRMVAEMMRVTRPGGVVAVYVWDYRDGMEMMRYFWDAAAEIDPGGSDLDEGERFPICQPGPLEALFGETGLQSVSVRAVEIVTRFRDFDDYWLPFLGKQGAAPNYLAKQAPGTQARIRDVLKARLRGSADGSISMNARAWAVKGIVPLDRGIT